MTFQPLKTPGYIENFEQTPLSDRKADASSGGTFQHGANNVGVLHDNRIDGMTAIAKQRRIIAAQSPNREKSATGQLPLQVVKAPH